MWSNFIKTSLRSLSKNLSYTLVNIIGLSIGLAVFIALVLYIQYELSFDDFQEHKDRLYRVEQIMNSNDRSERMESAPTPVWKYIKKEFPEVEYSSRYYQIEQTFVNKNAHPFKLKTAFVDNDFIKMFSYEIIAGDSENPLLEPNCVILPESLANKFFGEERALGQTIEIEEENYKVTAIIADPPKNSHLNINAFISISTIEFTYGSDQFTLWWNNWLTTYVLLKPNHNLAAFNAKIDTILKKWYKPECENQLLLRKAQDIHLYSNISGDYANRGSITTVYILSALSLFILIMAGVNFTNLSIAYSTRRTKEVAMRKIIGADRRLLLKQLLSESILIALFSLLIAFILFEIFLPWFNIIVNRELDLKYFENFKFLLSIIGITIILGFISGIYPALIIARTEPLNALKSGKKTKSGKSLLRQTLVGLQFIISACFIIGATSIYMQVNYMNNKDLGYKADQIININMYPLHMNDMSFFREQILKNPSVLKVSAHDYPIENSSSWTDFSWEGAEENSFHRISNNHVDQYFTDLYGLEFIAGENFAGPQIGNTVEGNRCILNEAAIKLMNLSDPIGKKIIYNEDYSGNIEGQRITISGVVKDFHFQSAHTKITPMVMILYREGLDAWGLSILISEKNINETLTFVETKYKEVFPNKLFQYEFIKERISDFYQEEKNLSNIVLYLAVLAIIIACLGIYGLISFTTNSRTKEIGIRKVLGSNSFSIYFLFAKEFLSLILIANIIAWPISYYIIEGWLNTFPYRIGFTIIPYAIAISITIIFAMLSMAYRIHKAINTNTVLSLKYE